MVSSHERTRPAAMSLGRTETALGACDRRLAFRVGEAKALTATTGKLAISVTARSWMAWSTAIIREDHHDGDAAEG